MFHFHGKSIARSCDNHGGQERKKSRALPWIRRGRRPRTRSHTPPALATRTPAIPRPAERAIETEWQTA